MPDLDDRIRSLVASAVADAPAAPDLDALGAPSPRRPGRRTWGALVLAALLAGLGGVAALQPADDTDVDTGRDTTTTAVATVPAPPVIVTAGQEGIVEIVGDRRRTVTTEPMAFALALDDGTFVAQRSDGGDGGSTYPVFIGNDGTITGEMFAGADLAGPVHLHDFSVVDGRRLLLYSIRVSGDPETASESLFALDLDSDDTIELGEIGGWEWGTSRLHLAKSGLVVGTSYSEASHALFVRALPGSPAADRPLPKATDFGLEEHYGDCTCPRAFSLDADGATLYWLAPTGTPGNSDDGTTVVAAALDDPRRASQVAPASRFSTFLVYALDPGERGVVVSFVQDSADGGQPPLLVNEDEATPLEGSIATTGPNG